ncbi:MAG: DUF6890 family protein [Parashewanella sp.]
MPHEDDSEGSLARAMWLHKHQLENMEKVTASGVSKGFNGKS